MTTTAPARWRLHKPALFVAILAIAGVVMFTYPMVAAWFHQQNQSLLIEGVGSTQSQETPAHLQAEIDRAHEYNSLLVGGALVGANANIPTGEGVEGESGEDYFDLLNATGDGIMGRLRIPAISLDLPMYHGTSDDVLDHGVGHLQGTSLPVGGASQHSVLTAHRGLASAELFTNLNKVVEGDTFTLEVFGEVLTYRAFDIKVVEPHESETLYPVADKDLVTLVTCTPLGINSHRILVVGERITPTPIGDLEAAGAPPEIPGFPWWALIYGAGLAGAGWYVRWAGKPATPKPDSATPDARA